MNFDIDELVAEDTGTMIVFSRGEPTNWVWIFAGPGHQRTIDQGDRIARERLHRSKAQEQARVNGKKWKAEDETVDEVMERNIQNILARLLDWHLQDKVETKDETGKVTHVEYVRSDEPVKFGGKPFPFTPENAKSLLLNPKTGSLLNQAIEYLGDESSFTKRSVTTSEASQSENLNSQDSKTVSATATNSKD